MRLASRHIDNRGRTIRKHFGINDTNETLHCLSLNLQTETKEVLAAIIKMSSFVEILGLLLLEITLYYKYRISTEIMGILRKPQCKKTRSQVLYAHQ